MIGARAWLLALRLAWRDLRGGIRGMRIVLACLALGVGAIGSIGTLRAALDRGLATEGSRLLGGDVAVESGAQPLPDALHDWIVRQGGRVSEVVRLRSLLVAPSGQRLLVELKAVDGAYPMVGAVRLAPAGALPAALARGLVVDPLVLQRLGLHEGDTVRLGEAQFPVAAGLAYEPDRGSALSIMGPPVLMRADALARTGLIQPGSLVTYEWRVLLRPGADPRVFTAALRGAFPQTGWRISDRTRAEPGVNRAIDQTSLFLVLVGLSALLVGGIGVATGVHAPPMQVPVGHVVPSGLATRAEHTPLVESQVPGTWQSGSPTGQTTAVPDMQVPAWQASPCVHALPSLHGRPDRGEQVPLTAAPAATEQALHVPAQAVLQQTPFAQKPLEQLALVEQVSPRTPKM